MKIKKSELKNILKEELSELTGNDTSKLEDLLEDLLDQLGKLDVSIDYLAASFTGEDPMNINISQTGLGRLKQAPMAKTKVQEKADIIKNQLKDLIKEIVNEEEEDKVKLGTKGMTKATQAGKLRSQAKGVQSGEIGGDFTNIERSLVQQISDVITNIASAPDVDLGKYRSQLNTVLNRLKNITGAEFD